LPKVATVALDVEQTHVRLLRLVVPNRAVVLAVDTRQLVLRTLAEAHSMVRPVADAVAVAPLFRL
jgi:hypothetical protein